MVRKPIRTYEVSVYGYGEVHYSARSPGKARAMAYRDFTECRSVTFHDFLTRSSVRRVPDPPGVGARILVCGKPATRCLGRTGLYGGGYYFMYDDGDAILTAHPTEIRTMPREQAADVAAEGQVRREAKPNEPVPSPSSPIQGLVEALEWIVEDGYSDARAVECARAALSQSQDRTP